MSDPAIARRGMMLVLSSPSGAGKTAISRELLDRDPDVTMSVSVTTRKKRPGEVAGRDYRFVDATEFNLMINRQELLEHAKVFGNYYGTPRAPVEQALSDGRDVIFDIDWQGAQQLKESARDDLVSVFILPPSHDELDRRLHTRAQDSEEVIAQRMAKASDEMSHWPEYDYIVVNRNLKESVAQVQAIVAAERLRRRRLIGLTEFVKRLQDGQ
jgi:guanylate kinase